MKTVVKVVLLLVVVLILSGVGMLGGCGEGAKPPTVTAVNPGSGRQGDTLDVTITGTYLADATTVSFGAGITVGSFTASSDTQISASVTIAASATQGSRDVSVTTPDGTATKTGGFMVTSPLAPSVTGISPDSGEQAESLDVVIMGSNFINVSDVSLGAGVTVDSFTVNSATEISASATIAPNALEAPRDVSVTNPSGTGVGGGIFTVTWPAALDELIAAAQAEGTLNILSSEAMAVQEIGDALEAAINEKYGIDIEIVMTPGPSMPALGSTILQEYEAGQKASSDLYYGTESHHPTLYDAGLYSTAFDWKELFPYIPDESLQLGGTVVETASIFIGMAYSTIEIPEDEVPRNMEGVLGKGWDLASTIYGAGFDRVADLPNWGYERTKQFLEDLSAELAGLTRCDEEDRIVSGEFTAMVLTCGDRGTKRLQAQGAPIAHVLFDDVPIMNHRGIGIPKNSEHPNLAALFTGYLLTSKGQQILADMGFISSHRIEGSEMYEEYNAYLAQGIEFADMTCDYVYPRLDQFNTWRAEFQEILQGGG